MRFFWCSLPYCYIWMYSSFKKKLRYEYFLFASSYGTFCGCKARIINTEAEKRKNIYILCNCVTPELMLLKFVHLFFRVASVI